MKNKRKFTFLPLIFASALMLGACGLNNPADANKNNGKHGWAPEVKSYEQTSKGPKTSSEQGGGQGNTSSGPVTPSKEPAKKTFIVTFVANGMPVQISQVKEGECAVYTGETPTKRGDKDSLYYRFKKWDKDIKAPITADTTFNAVFTHYDNVAMIDDFESYADSPSMIDEGWAAMGYNNTTGWSEDTKAAVSLGSKSIEGQKALRFDAWGNNNDYKFVKHIPEGAFPNAVNALKFRLMVPSYSTVKVILNAAMEIDGKLQAPAFHYTIKPTSSEYVEYTIPLDDAGWALWGEAGKSIKAVADWIGVHQDDVVNYLTRIDFYVKANDGVGGQPYVAFLDSAKFVTIKDAAKSEDAYMEAYPRYTGKLATGNTVVFDVKDDMTAKARVVDLEVPEEIDGKVTVNANGVMTFTSKDNGAKLKYVGQVTNGGQKVKFVSADGAYKQAVGEMDLDAVQVVDNFEQYKEDGKAYYQSNKDVSQRSGCRGAYYSEYYSGSGSSPWGGNGWSLLGGDGSQLKLKNDGNGHNGSKNYLCLKHSKSVAFRYMQWGLFDGTAEQNSFRGSKFSFWAKTNGLVKSFKVSMFSQSAPTNATKENYVRAETFTQTAAIGQWKHFEIDLNPSLVYYGYMIFTEKNTGLSANESWLYIDDVEVYTANPYAVFVPPAADKLLEKGQVFFAKMANIASMQLDIIDDTNCNFKLLNQMDQAATYSYNGNRVTFDFGTHGQYVAKLNETATKLTFVSATGDVANYFNNLSFDAVDVLDNAETYETAGKMWYQSSGKSARSGARGAWYCDYYAGGSAKDDVGGSGWSLMGGNGDQLTLETASQYVHSGTQSLKMKRNQTNAMRYMTFGLCDGTAVAHKNANYLVYWAKNPNSKALTIKTSVYAQAQVTPSTQSSNRVYVEASIPANSDWTRVVIPLKATSTYYGVAFTAGTTGSGSADWFYVDDIMFYSADNNVCSAYSPYEGLTLSGNIVAGPASITFGKLGSAKLTCQALGGTLDVTYQQVDQDMMITVAAGNGSQIIGTFNPISETEIAFIVTSVTGDLAPYVQAGTMLKSAALL